MSNSKIFFLCSAQSRIEYHLPFKIHLLQLLILTITLLVVYALQNEITQNKTSDIWRIQYWLSSLKVLEQYGYKIPRPKITYKIKACLQRIHNPKIVTDL